MATLSADKFVDLVRKSGLVEEDRLNSVLSEISHRSTDSAGGEGESDPLAEALVERKLLTRWQCDRLKEGRHKGFILGKYKLLGLLGTGGMSSVYLAEHMLMQRRVAIKVLPRSRVDDSSYLARFRREAQAVAALDHRNIVRAYDIDNEGNTHYLVMEHVDGRDLNTIVKNDGPLEYDAAAEYIRQAAEGLEHAHEANLIHRDVKPANLLIDPRGMVKILDMGLARFTDEQQTSLTRLHDENVLGTADYLAPEQAKDSHAADHRADIYSLGCTLYYLLTGRPPFNEGTLAQRIAKHQTQSPPSIYESRPDAPQALVDVCMRMMAKQPGARFQTASEVARTLGKWLAGRGKTVDSVSSGATPAPRPAAPPRRSATTQPGQPKTDSPDDTVSDRTRITIKGQSRGPAAKSPKQGSSPGGAAARPAAGAAKGDATAAKPTAGQQPGRVGSPAAKSPGGSSVNKAGVAKGLPVARPIDESGKTKAIAATPVKHLQIEAESLSAAELLSRNKFRNKPAAPQWFWWAAAGGALLAVILLVIVFLSQLD
jgi:serine/threonine-protein kinase